MLTSRKNLLYFLRFRELGIDNGVIVARTDSQGAGLTKEIAVVKNLVTKVTSTTHT